MTITATEVTKIEGWMSDARLFKLSEPVQFTAFEEETTAEYAIVSALDIEGLTETAVWAADESGLPTMLGTLLTVPEVADHKAAIEAAGWELVAEEV